MKKSYLALILVSFIILSCLFLFISRKNSSVKSPRLLINKHLIFVEVADTDELRREGLSGRDKIGENQGMLFVFPSPGYYSFWMKEMRFPLDLIWINKDTIIDLTENVPYPPSNTKEAKLPTYSPQSPADKVLEVNTGTIQKLKIKKGDKVQFL